MKSKVNLDKTYREYNMSFDSLIIFKVVYSKFYTDITQASANMTGCFEFVSEMG